VADNYILLNDGTSKILLNNGTDKLLMNSELGAAVSRAVLHAVSQGFPAAMAFSMLHPIMMGIAASNFTTPPLLLDTYTNAKVAYSFRKLRNAYAGSAVRIRRSSDNAEADIGFSGTDFDAAAAAAHIGGGTGFIVTWYDQSGNGYDLTQSTAGAQPTYVASGIGSLPCLDFVAASSTRLKTTDNAIALGGTDLSVFTVATLDSASSSSGRLTAVVDNSTDYDNNESAVLISRNSTNQEIANYRNGVASQKAMTYGTAARFATIYDGSNENVFVNASGGTPAASSATWGAGVTGWAGAGVEFGTPFLFWDGNASEIVWWASDQTANLAAIDTNQSTYYGI
jgi:hypothetical protein